MGFDGGGGEEEEDHTHKKKGLYRLSRMEPFTCQMTFTHEVFKVHWFHTLIDIDLLGLNCIDLLDLNYIIVT